MRAAWIVCAVVVAGSAPVAADQRLDRALAQQVCEAQDPRCDWLATLSSLERATVKRGLARRGYEIEPAPWGKIIERVHIYNEEVFAEGSRVLRFFNKFHVTTKEYAVRHELVIGEGELWDQERVQETARRLRDPLYTSIIVVLPVRATDPTKVDMLVVTRDVWSLRLNTQYTFSATAGQRKLVGLQMAVSENNFLGTRSVLAAALNMDQGAIATGPLFIDKNLFGTHIELRARVDALIAREDFFLTPGCDASPLLCATSNKLSREGSQSTIAISKPLWSLASKWGAGASFSHRFGVNRSFNGFDLDTYDYEGTPEHDMIPRHYRTKQWGTSVFANRQLGGKRLKHTFSIAQSFGDREITTRGSFPSPEAREAFIADVLPRVERTSVLSVSYGLFTPRYRTVRNISTYELAEDIRYGPDFDVSYGVGLKLIGSENNFQLAGASLAWTFPWCRDGLVRPSAAVNIRIQDLPGDPHRTIDNTASVGVRAVSPMYWYARVVAQASVSTRWHDTQNVVFTHGQDDGLRGYGINEFRTGDDATRPTLFRGQLEVRSIPRPLWVLRFGGVVFYEVGGISNTLRAPRLFSGTVTEGRLFHDIGIGLRLLIPQTSRELLRFDLAFPLQNGPAGTKAFSPAFIAGFESAF